MVGVDVAFRAATGVGRGVEAGFVPELEGNAAGDPLLLARLESRVFGVATEADRSAEFLLPVAGAVNLVALGFRLNSALLLAA